MRKLVLALMACVISVYGFAREWDDRFGFPVVSLIETNPWLMVIGSDVPTIAIYESGYVIYRRVENRQMKYFFVKLDFEQTQELIFELGITDELMEIPEFIQASDRTSQPRNILTLVFEDIVQKMVYGDLRNDSEARARTPAEFLVVFDNLIAYKNENEKPWMPDYIEVMLSDFSHSIEIPVEWPREWPDLNSETTVQRHKMLYSVYIHQSEFQKFIELISSLLIRHAVKVNGRMFSVSYRLPFPNF